MVRSELISDASFRALHPNTIEEPEEIRALLLRVHREAVTLRRATNRRVEPELARIEQCGDHAIRLRTWNFEPGGRHEVFLNLTLDGRSYFFSSPRLGDLEDDSLIIAFPSVVYIAERRDRPRLESTPAGTAPSLVALSTLEDRVVEARVQDHSADGLGLSVPAQTRLERNRYQSIRFLDGPRVGETAYAALRHRSPIRGRPGWHRIGLAVTSTVPSPPLNVERYEDLPASAVAKRTAVSAGVRLWTRRILPRLRRGARGQVTINIVDYKNDVGEGLRAIVDAWGDTRGAPAVVIPPAWGKTKETLLPLASTIVETFRRAGEPVVVIRFDGIRKRGESHTEPECRAPGMENTRFTFSQGVRDIQTTLDYLERDLRFQPSICVLISFSGASIDARRAVALERTRLGGWVCVVGSADLQAMMRTISGGVDFLGGVERGVRFGFQEILGLLVDVDTSSRDALDHKMAFLDDARRDLAEIDLPITWIHGRFDAWMDRQRIRHALSFGDTSRRRLIEVPTGHQLKTSREALETFQLIAGECARMALGREIPAHLPDLLGLERRRQAERKRRPRTQVDTRDFWRRYLLGRQGRLGMELLTSTAAYHVFMDAHTEALQLGEDCRIADLGSGTGSFPRHLSSWSHSNRKVEVLELDYVEEALQLTRLRLSQLQIRPDLRVRYIECDLDLTRRGDAIPLASGSCDRAVGALLLNYLDDPRRLLRETFRILKPGGRMVMSSLKQDADISKICVEGADELRAGRAREAFGAEAEKMLDESIRSFINDAARVLDLEELGIFNFWDAPEFERMVKGAGFKDIDIRPAFGDPPQAMLISARRQ